MLVTSEQNAIVVCGSVNRDYLVEIAARPRPGETVTGGRLSIAPGGKGANQAVAASLLGVEVRLIAAVGDDASGRELLTTLRARGVDTGNVIVDPKAATGAAFITVTPDGENAIIVVSGANSSLGAEVLKQQRSVIQESALLLLQLEVSDDVVEAALGLAGNETFVVLNAAPYRALSLEAIERVDLLVVNAVEAFQLVGHESSLQDPTEFSRIGAPTTVVTLGGSGVRAFVSGEVLYQDAPRRHVVDTTGAGDAFVGALGAWLVREQVSRRADLRAPLARALTAATLAAAYSVQRLGAQPSYGTCEDLGPPWH